MSVAVESQQHSSPQKLANNVARHGNDEDNHGMESQLSVLAEAAVLNSQQAHESYHPRPEEYRLGSLSQQMSQCDQQPSQTELPSQGDVPLPACPAPAMAEAAAVSQPPVEAVQSLPPPARLVTLPAAPLQPQHLYHPLPMVPQVQPYEQQAVENDAELERLHPKSKATRRGPMDEMRQLVRILVKIIPHSVVNITTSEEGGGGNRISEEQIKGYLANTLGDAPAPTWGVPEGWGNYLSKLFSWAISATEPTRHISREQAMRCAKREPGRSWEALEGELNKLGLYPSTWRLPLSLDGIRAGTTVQPVLPAAAKRSADELPKATPAKRHRAAQPDAPVVGSVSGAGAESDELELWQRIYLLMQTARSKTGTTPLEQQSILLQLMADVRSLLGECEAATAAVASSAAAPAAVLPPQAQLLFLQAPSGAGQMLYAPMPSYAPGAPTVAAAPKSAFQVVQPTHGNAAASGLFVPADTSAPSHTITRPQAHRVPPAPVHGQAEGGSERLRGDGQVYKPVPHKAELRSAGGPAAADSRRRAEHDRRQGNSSQDTADAEAAAQDAFSGGDAHGDDVHNAGHSQSQPMAAALEPLAMPAPLDSGSSGAPPQAGATALYLAQPGAHAPPGVPGAPAGYVAVPSSALAGLQLAGQQKFVVLSSGQAVHMQGPNGHMLAVPQGALQPVPPGVMQQLLAGSGMALAVSEAPTSSAADITTSVINGYLAPSAAASQMTTGGTLGTQGRPAVSVASHPQQGAGPPQGQQAQQQQQQAAVANWKPTVTAMLR